MLIKIVLDSDDYLTYHLYLASKSESLKKRRFIHWLSIPLVYIITGFVFVYLKGAEIVRTIFFVTAGLWLLLYPFYSKWAIRRFLLRQIHAKYTPLISKEGSLKLGEKKITVKSTETSMDIEYGDIKDIIELTDYYLIGLNVGSSLILPKKKIEADLLGQLIDKISQKTGIHPTVETLWGWK